MDVIHSKTAKLFEAASQLGAILSDYPKNKEQQLAKYGMHLGTAFQLIDDVMDYQASSEEMGKNVGDDLAEGKPTLPLIVALCRSEGETAQQIRVAIEEGGLHNLDNILQAIQTTDALEYTINIAQNEVELAIAQLDCLPDSQYKSALEALAWLCIERTH